MFTQPLVTLKECHQNRLLVQSLCLVTEYWFDKTGTNYGHLYTQILLDKLKVLSSITHIQDLENKELLQQQLYAEEKQ
jgi:hypothetical protein